MCTKKPSKNGKAANDVPTAYIKCAIKCKEFQDEMVNLCKSIWDTKKIPTKWGHSKLVAMWKGASKGSYTDPRSYRGLQIGSSLCKTIIIIIINRLNSWYENQLLDQQQGFRPGRGTSDGIFIVKRIHEISDKMKKPVYAIFIDLTAAFDHIERKWMFKTIHQRFHRDADRSLIELLESLYTYTTTELAQAPNYIFELTSGVRQGGPESPILFNLYMDYVMRIFHEECDLNQMRFLNLKYCIPSSASTRDRIKTGAHTTDWIGYADDIVLMFEDIKNMQRAINILSIIFSKYNLELNITKTKSMILNQQYLNSKYPNSIVLVNGEQIENMRFFKYLGCQLTYNEPCTSNSELEIRIDTAEKKFYELGKKLMDHRIMLTTRVKIFNSLVRSRLTYACQTWNLTKRQSDHINAAYMAMVRKMIKGGYRRKEGSYSYEITNLDLLEKCKIESITTYIKRQQRNYVAHIIRKPDTSITKKLLFNDNQYTKQGQQKSLYKSVITNEQINPDVLHRKALSRQY